MADLRRCLCELYDAFKADWWAQKSAVALFAVMLLGVFAYMIFLYDTTPISSVSARTERVLVRIANDDLGSIPLGGLAQRTDNPFVTDTQPSCVSGLFVPTVGSIVEYVRMAEGDLRISIRPPAEDAVSGSLHPADGEPQPVKGAAHFVAASQCPDSDQAPRYPVWGAVALGDDIRAPVPGSDVASALLLDGKILVSARSATFFGLLPSTLYRASEIDLPMGSRVSEVGPDDMPAGTLWAGYVALRKGHDALEFRAQTEARNLKIYLPGQRSAADQIRIGVIIPLFQDPYLLIGQVVFAGFFIVLDRFISLMQYFFPRKPGNGSPGRIRPMKARTIALAAGILLVLVIGAGAETVLVRHGTATGNGWLFVDREGRCMLATPAHVVQPAFPSGPLVDVLVTDRKGRTLEAGRGSVPQAGVDLAFLQVRPFDQKFLCTRSRLGGAGLAARIEALREGDIEIMGEGGLQRETVERIAQSRTDLASTITVRPKNAGFTLVEGYSGSMILDGATPVAMVTNVVGEANVAIALRFDAIAENSPGPVAPPPDQAGAVLEVFALAGSTPDPGHPPSASVGQTGWTAEPEDGRVALEFIPGDADLKGLSFDAEGAPDGKAFLEHRARTGSDYAYVVSCPIKAGHAACSFGSRRLDIVRLTIRAGEKVTLRNLAVLR